ncbi:MAG: hypothetical protein HY282_02910 [Nitrospirae bacterium]|nr:hypothetical protein [Candidatus Manganitrophaceae bacterium]
MKKTIGLAVLFLLLLEIVPPSAHADDTAKQVFTDGFYGGLAGALVGAAVMAFTKHPSDHLKDIAVGAGAGVIAGTLYGIGKASRAFAEIDNGHLTVQLPTLRFEAEPVGKGVQPCLSADLLHVPF